MGMPEWELLASLAETLSRTESRPSETEIKIYTWTEPACIDG
jgi:hypothetical protein